MKPHIRFLVTTLALCWGGTLFGTSAQAQDKPVHWSYSGALGPSKWGELAPGFATCRTGSRQSPIDIVTKSARKLDTPRPIEFAYTSSAAEAVNTGHTIQVNPTAAGTIRLDGREYRLVQFHFHTPSEERFDGRSYPLVAHLVHANAEGRLAVVAVLFRVGRENPALETVFAAMPPAEGARRTLDTAFDVGTLLPADRSYYAFYGSLTTPPCSEEVAWRVLRTPVELSSAQLAAFRKLYPMNARDVQPLNGRTVEFSG